MTFAQAIKSGFANYANFTGRASRSEFWFWSLFYCICLTIALLIGTEIHRSEPVALFFLTTALPMVAVTVRRLHDLGRSGFAFPLLSFFVPIAGPIVMLVWFRRKGTFGPNNFGPDPLAGIGQPREFKLGESLLVCACGCGAFSVAVIVLADLPRDVSPSDVLPFAQTAPDNNAALGTSERLLFEKIETIEGLWRAESAFARVQLERTGDDVGEARVGLLHRDEWGSTIHYTIEHHIWEVFPDLEVSILVPYSTAHNWIKVSAEMTIVYPEPGGPHSFMDERQTVKTASRFFVVTPREYGLATLSGYFFVIAVLLAFLGAVAVIVRKLRRRKSDYATVLTK